MSRVVWLSVVLIIFVVIGWAGLALAAGDEAPLLAATPTPSSSLGALSGTVYNAEGQPVAGATVRIKLTDQKTTTAANGSFTLSAITTTQPVSVTAWAEGYYVGWTNATPGATTTPVSITLKPHYTTDNLDYGWFEFEGKQGNQSCALCHIDSDQAMADAHAQSAVNPRFLGLYLGKSVDGQRVGPGYKLDYPSRSGWCAACHTPLASNLEPSNTCGWSGCHTTTTAANAPQVPDGVSPAYLTGAAADGISCDFCHKIGEVYLDPHTKLPYADRPGISSMRLYRPQEGDQIFFGTHDDVTRRVSYLPLLEESAYCAPCHYGVFGGVVGDKQVTGGIVIYNSYGEWLDSPYSDPETGQTCQDCHMPPLDSEYFAFPEKGGLPRAYKPPHQHLMPGARDEQLLQNSVTMTTTAELVGEQVLVEVSIANDKTGHHVPTDTPLRHLILVVQATAADGNLLPLQDGPQLPEWTGNYADQPGRYYAKILADTWTGEAPTAAYWRDLELVEDTRLAAFATDVSQYAFAVPAKGPVTVETRLIFRRAFQKLMAEKGWDDPDIVMEEDAVKVVLP